MSLNQQLGNLGESLACNYLLQNNYSILERNFNCKQGEIDIIAFDNFCKELVFIEVKTRSNLKFGNPSDSINKVKRNHIISSAKYYIYKNKIKNTYIRLDALEIFIKNNTYKINHLKQIL